MSTTKNNPLQCTTWDNSSIYRDLNDPQINKDLKQIEQNTENLARQTELLQQNILMLSQGQTPKLNEQLSTHTDFLVTEKATVILLRTLSVYASCFRVVDSENTAAKELASKVMKLSAEFGKTTKPMQVFLSRAPETFINELFENEQIKDYRFKVQHSRKQQDHLLSVQEEKLITGLSTDGLHAWGKLYTDLASSIKVDVDGKKIGLAAAASNLRGGDRQLREKSYRAIETGWQTHREAAAAILNAINGWRNEVYRSRSHKKNLDFLDASCHVSRISRKTLDTLMQTTFQRIEVGREANRQMAKALKVEKISPWDSQAPSPFTAEAKPVAFPQAMELICNAFEEFDPKMSEFAKMMAEKNWIDALPTENRSPGAFCTKFSNVREPRVFLTYEGTMGDIITLAHEIGHAYHNWVLKDVPFFESEYSMTLAETASVFAETLVREHILKQAQTKDEKLQILWQELISASAFLVNIPTRFEFEKALVEGREEKFVPPADLCQLMSDVSQKWYGETLSEMPQYFWASKLHFAISGLSFYNYPYLFGYLFSLGIYNQKEKLAEQFKALYQEILIDTGKMTAEDLVKKNLNLDIESAEFWNGSIDQVQHSIEMFAKTLEA